jgi:hypothetical protein
MKEEDKVKHVKTTEKYILIDIFRYISRNKVNKIFGNIKEKLFKNVLSVLDPSLYMYLYVCLDKYSVEYVWHNSLFSCRFFQNVIFTFESDGIEDKKILERFVKDFADNSKSKEQIIELLVMISKKFARWMP